MQKNILHKAWYMIAAILMVVVAISILCTTVPNQFRIDGRVVIPGSVLLGVLAILNTYMHYNALQNANPNALVRSVLLSTIIKFTVIIGAIALYFFFAKENRSIGAIAIVMTVYVIFLVLETWATTQMNKVKNGNS